MAVTPHIPVASATEIGGIKVGSGLAIDPAGVLTASGDPALPYVSASCTVPFTIPPNALTVMSTWTEDKRRGDPGVTVAAGSLTLSDGKLYSIYLGFEWSAPLGGTGEVTYEFLDNGVKWFDHMMDIGHATFTGTYAWSSQFAFLTPTGVPSELQTRWNTTVAPPNQPVTLNRLRMLVLKMAEV